MEMIIGFLGGAAIIGALNGLWRSTKIESFSEADLMAELIRKRSDRYVRAVAKDSAEKNIEVGAREQATNRLRAQGVEGT
jgi:hypothetical protein